MAKRKSKKNRNIGDNVDILNYISPDHIIKIRYNTGNNDINITDIPQNLNSSFTLGQGGGGSVENPLISVKLVSNSMSDLSYEYVNIDESILMYYFGVLESSQETTFNCLSLNYQPDNMWGISLNKIIPDLDIYNVNVSNTSNVEYDDGFLSVTDPTESAACTITLSDI